MRTAVAISAATVLLTAVLAIPAPAGAAVCDTDTGVSVIVDYAGLGGGVVTGCAGDTPTSGFGALSAAGFQVTQVANMPGFVCRIDGKPSADAEPCVDTPPATAFWTYWIAERGGSWRVSARGAGSRVPPPGGVEGWSFSTGANRPPTMAPPPPATTTTSTTSTTSTTVTTTTTASSTTTSSTTTTTVAVPMSTTSTTSTSSTTTTATSATSTTPTTSTSTTHTTTSTTTTAPPATTTTENLPLDTPIPSEPPPAPGPGGTVAGIALVAVVGATAWLATHRRARD